MSRLLSSFSPFLPITLFYVMSVFSPSSLAMNVLHGTYITLKWAPDGGVNIIGPVSGFKRTESVLWRQAGHVH